MGQSALFLMVSVLGLLAGPLLAKPHKPYNITIGYLPTISSDMRNRQGLAISGALSLAVEMINNDTGILPEVELLIDWHDNKFDTDVTTRLMTDMSRAGVVVFFGPEGRCKTEANLAQSLNLPMISYKCFDYPTWSLSNFVKVDPPGTQAIKSVISLLRCYRWNKFSIIYDESWVTEATTLESLAKYYNMTVSHKRLVIEEFKCCLENMPCCTPNYWYRLIQDTRETRIYVFLGTISNLINMMDVMEALQLFSKCEYLIIFVDMMAYSPVRSFKYLTKTENQLYSGVCPNTLEYKKRAQSLLVVGTSEFSADAFEDQVRKYNTMTPFKFRNMLPFKTFVSIHAAYLYDSVMLYATALDEIIKEDTRNEKLTDVKLREIATNGTRIVATIKKGSPYKSVSGMSIRLDEHGASVGNFSLLAFRPVKVSDEYVNCTYGMVPVRGFQLNDGEYACDREYRIAPWDGQTCGGTWTHETNITPIFLNILIYIYIN